MNDKMKTAIAIIAIACLCACAAPTKQPPTQTSRTAKPAPTQQERKQSALDDLEDFVRSMPLDDPFRRLRYAPYSDETLIFLYQGIQKEIKTANLPELQTNEGKNLLQGFIMLTAEMRDRKILTSETINVVLNDDQIAQAFKELSAQDVLPKNE